MGPSFRYHISTMVAIFLALGIGMVIGSSYLQGAIVEGLTRQQRELNARFTAEVAPLRDEKQRYVDWTDKIRPVLLKDRLAGRRVALVQTGDYSGLAPVVRDALEAAGATATSLTVVSRVYAERADRNLSTLLSRLRDTHPNLELDRSALVRVFATAVARGGASADLDVLEQGGLLERDGDYSRGVQCVVLIGGAKDESAAARIEALDRGLIAQLKERNVRVVVVEPSDAAVSYVPLLQGLDVSTVDNADTDLGQVAAVLALDSPTSDYGTKRTARGGLVPRPNEVLP